MVVVFVVVSCKRRLIKAEQAAKEEAKRLEMMLADEQRKNGELHQTAAQILADKKAAAKRQIEYIAAKWAGGANK
ncbi:unnamed protein product, partial [Symbiodinium microadriaticum]